MQQPNDLKTKFAATFSEIVKNHSERPFNQNAEKDTKHRGSRPEVFWNVDVLKNFERFTKKHLCRSLFICKVAGWISAA